jgi:hypothetical protein
MIHKPNRAKITFISMQTLLNSKRNNGQHHPVDLEEALFSKKEIGVVKNNRRPQPGRRIREDQKTALAASATRNILLLSRGRCNKKRERSNPFSPFLF